MGTSAFLFLSKTGRRETILRMKVFLRIGLRRQLTHKKKFLKTHEYLRHNTKVKMRTLSYLQKIHVLLVSVKRVILFWVIMLYKCISL